VQDVVNQEESEQNEVDGTKKEGRRCQLFLPGEATRLAVAMC